MSATPTPDVRRRSAAHVLLDSSTDIAADRLALADDVEHHLVRVLRLRDSDTVTVTDGAGRWRPCRLDVGRQSLTLEPSGAVTFEPRGHDVLTVATAIPKGDRVDWLVQKVTEIGADRVVLLHAERSVVRWKPDRARRQVARLQRIADESTRQCRRVWRTEVAGPVAAAEILPGVAATEPSGRLVDQTDTSIAVGPEGGWTPTELDLAADLVQLGPNVLRIETAAVVGTALCVTIRH